MTSAAQRLAVLLPFLLGGCRYWFPNRPPPPPPEVQFPNQYRCAVDVITPLGDRINLDGMVCVPFELNENIGGRGFTLNDLRTDCQKRIADYYIAFLQNDVPASGGAICRDQPFQIHDPRDVDPTPFAARHKSCNGQCSRAISTEPGQPFTGLRQYFTACTSPASLNGQDIIGQVIEPCVDPEGQGLPLLVRRELAPTSARLDSTSSLGVTVASVAVPVSVRQALIELPEKCSSAQCLGHATMHAWLNDISFDGHTLTGIEVSLESDAVVFADGRFLLPSGSPQITIVATVDGVTGYFQPRADSPAFGLIDFDALTFSLRGDFATDPSDGTPLTLRLRFSGTLSPPPPIISAGNPHSVECSKPGGADITLDGRLDRSAGTTFVTWYELLSSGPSEPNGRRVIGSGLTPTVFLSLGRHRLRVEATDSQMRIRGSNVDIDVVDTQPARIESATLTPSCLWPPNHKLQRYSVERDVRIVATDVCDSSPTVSVLSIVSSEPDDGLGDGATQTDLQQPTSSSFCVRAERSGMADSRSYTVQLGLTDRSGNRTVTNAVVSVPHSNSPGCRPATEEVCQ